MFRCQATGRVSRPGEKPVRLVVATREKTYYGGKDGKEVIGQGFEVVREITVCQEYARSASSNQV
jgi:hypothetical protein